MNIPTNPIFPSVTDPDDQRDIEIERAMPVREVKSRPILFSGEMVRAILDGRKTQTRRVVKLPLHCRSTGCELTPGELNQREINSADTLCSYGAPGDHLWVRETFAVVDVASFYFKRPGSFVYKEDPNTSRILCFRSPRFMPRWVSRITLEIVGIRVERLHQISESDARSEGVINRVEYSALWDSINGKNHPWASNPRVWVIEFRRIKP